MESKRYNQIDVLKGLAIIFVILLHALRSFWIKIDILTYSYAFLIQYAIPIFMILLGITYTLSFKNHKYKSLKECYSKEYFKRKFKRIVLSYFVIYIIALIIQIIFFESKFNELMKIGYIPNSRFGNYFFLILIQFIIIFPLVYYCYIKKPKITIISCIIMYIFYYISFYIIPRTYISFELQKISIFRDMIYIILGIWFIDKYKQEKIHFLKENKFIIYLFILNVFYLILTYIFEISIHFYRVRGTFPVFIIFYVFVLVIIGIMYFPKQANNKISKSLTYIGKCSYHIYLIQMVWFGILFLIGIDLFIIYENLLILLFISFVFCFILGILFYELNNYVELKLNKK